MIKAIDLKDKEKWDQIVKSFSTYDVYYLAGYVNGFKIHGDGEPRLLYYEKDGIKAMNVVMIRDLKTDQLFEGRLNEQWYDMTTPYGYGGFIYEGTVTKEFQIELGNAYTKFCLRNNIVSDFVRFHPLNDSVQYLEHDYDLRVLGKTISVDLTTLEDVPVRFTSKNRGKIRKALKNGVEVFWGQEKKLYTKFKELYNHTMDTDNASNYYYFGDDFFDSIAEDLKYNSMFFYAVFEGEIIAMSLILMSNKQLNYHLNASLREYQYLAPNNLTLAEVCSWGCENGYESFHLGGGLGCREDGIYKFKSGFNVKSDVDFYLGKKIIDQEKYDHLIELRKNDVGFDPESEYFPRYRTQSEILT